MAGRGESRERSAVMASLPFGRSWLREWTLDPAGTYLDHGTVGVTPRRVMDVQRA